MASVIDSQLAELQTEIAVLEPKIDRLQTFVSLLDRLGFSGPTVQAFRGVLEAHNRRKSHLVTFHKGCVAAKEGGYPSPVPDQVPAEALAEVRALRDLLDSMLGGGSPLANNLNVNVSVEDD